MFLGNPVRIFRTDECWETGSSTGKYS